jgi:hypothetical protein
MHPEDLKMIWICQECDSHFIFHADVTDHKEQTGHTKVTKADMVLSSSDSQVNLNSNLDR